MRVTHVRVTFSPTEEVTSGSIGGADARMLARPPDGVRYEYTITWEDGTKHTSRSRERTITAALADWVRHFSELPPDKKAKADPGILEHLARLTSGKLESS